MSERFVCPPDHKHGLNLTCYMGHRCRCDDCRAKNTLHGRTVSRLKAYGRWDNARTAVAPVRLHIMILARFGYSYEQIARAAGIEARTVYRCMNDGAGWLRGRVAAAILAVAPTLDDLDPGTLIPTTGAQRRLQALGCLGWTYAAVAVEAGLPKQTVSNIARRSHLTVASHLTIASTYERLWNRPAPAETQVERRDRTATLNRAAAAGWVPPLAWDDIDTDPEPQAGEEVDIDQVAIDLAIAGDPVQLTREERHIALRELHARGHFDGELAARLGVDVRTIERDRKHLALPANYWNEIEAAA